VARSARPLKIGTLRPAIVLYDEPHPLGDDIGTIQTADIGRKPDMLIIMGTSLKVHGLKKLVKDFAKTVHTSATSSGKPLSPKNNNKSTKSLTGKVIFVNRTPLPVGEWSDIIDYHVAGETDTWVDKVVEDWKRMRPADWEVQKTLDGADGEDSPFKVVKEIPVAKAKGELFGLIHWTLNNALLDVSFSWQEETSGYREYPTFRTPFRNDLKAKTIESRLA
jgi:NAD-dependent histone deacetylase SIR2